ncbi:hypothetical protein LY76DRAFT_394426 [Colletotrichum caudatum]|nr:hypothetical protein LY76DRAFT_394426 [Colletotrichum caudatum]
MIGKAKTHTVYMDIYICVCVCVCVCVDIDIYIYWAEPRIPFPLFLCQQSNECSFLDLASNLSRSGIRNKKKRFRELYVVFFFGPRGGGLK